jgi:hypothetical protein
MPPAGGALPEWPITFRCCYHLAYPLARLANSPYNLRRGAIHQPPNRGTGRAPLVIAAISRQLFVDDRNQQRRTDWLLQLDASACVGARRIT